MRILLLAALLSAAAGPVFPEGLRGRAYRVKADGPRYSSHDITIRFTDSTVSIPEYLPSPGIFRGEEESPCTVRLKNKVPYIEYGTGERRRGIVLYSSDILLIYNEDDTLLHWGARPSPDFPVMFCKAEYTASSYLVEDLAGGRVEYGPEKLGQFKTLGQCWANGGGNYAVGETITLRCGRDTGRLLFSNGYVAYSRPDLYTKNSRVRTVRVRDRESGAVVETELEDTPKPQWIELNGPGRIFELEILAVYQGTKYRDTCINFILPEMTIYEWDPYLGPQGQDTE